MKEDRIDLKLSDMFSNEVKGEACLECIAHVININPGYNDHIINGCRKMFEYVNCIGTIRKYCAGVSGNDKELLSARIEAAIDECIEKGYLADIFLEELTTSNLLCLI